MYEIGLRCLFEAAARASSTHFDSSGLYRVYDPPSNRWPVPELIRRAQTSSNSGGNASQLPCPPLSFAERPLFQPLGAQTRTSTQSLSLEGTVFANEREWARVSELG